MVVLIRESLMVMIGWGCTNLSGTKRIMISLPTNLLKEVDGMVEKDKSNRSEFIRQAMKLYLQERKKRRIREAMQRGYINTLRLDLSFSTIPSTSFNKFV